MAKKKPAQHRNRKQFRRKILVVLLCTLMSAPVLAAGGQGQTVNGGDDKATVLKEVNVTGKRVRGHRREKDLTGLGKTVKTAETLDKQQVSDIRDLVRYDPGVAVVEQGRGASSGYSIRGVDKNRVATVVDGIAQAQSYTVQGFRPGSGAINEVEYENIASVEISKGASSSEYGSGSLGGAVGFRSKEAADIISAGKNYGLRSKTAYYGKNGQTLQSLAAAGRWGNWEGLAQYTARRGREIRPHKDAVNNTVYEVTRLGGYTNEYDTRYPEGSGFKRSTAYFLLADECPTLDCAPKAFAAATESPPHAPDPNHSAEQAAIAARSQHITERIRPRDFTGSGRAMPDPLRYRTGSWLVRGAYHFSPKHHAGAVFEHTVQRYDSRDMSLPAYYPTDHDFRSASGLYGNNPYDGIHVGNIGLQWARTRWVDEKHRKVRSGLFYRYQNPDKNSWADRFQLAFDRQDIGIDNTLLHRYCSAYPHVDKNCTVSTDKPWSYRHSEQNRYSERHNLLRAEADKEWRWGISRHRFHLSGGIDRFDSKLRRGQYFSEYAVEDYESLATPAGKRRPNGSYDAPYLYRKAGSRLIYTDNCLQSTSSHRACGLRHISGSNLFFTLRDNISFGRYADVSVGMRYDRHRFRSQDPWTADADYRNLSWNGGLVLKPSSHVALSYRASSGYRVPSFQELFGYRLPGHEQGKDDKYHHPTRVSPEKSLNHEWALTLKGNAGTLELAQFDNRYRDLIAVAHQIDRNAPLKQEFAAYQNAQDIRLSGINISGRLDANGLWDRLPEGLYATFAYNRIKPKSVRNKDGFTFVESYLLDTVQPSRYIFGVGYDHPEEKWGINLNFTYSKPKNPDELLTYYRSHSGKLIHKAGSGQTSKSWKTADLSAYAKLRNWLTLRASVFNLGNYRYLTWESLRQTSAGAVNRHSDGGNYARYAAPGRHVALSLEMKF